VPVFDIEQYAKDLAAAGVAQELIDKLTTEVKPGFMRQDTFSRRQQELDREKQRVETLYGQLSEYETYVKSLEAQYGPREQWSATFQARVGQYNPDGTGNLTSAADFDAKLQTALKEQESRLTTLFTQQLEQVGQGAAAFADFSYDAKERWRDEYGKVFPKDEFKKFYQENGHTNPVVALQLFEAPFKAEKEKADWERRIKEAETAAEQRVRSQLGSPEVGSSGTWDAQTSIGVAASLPITAPAAGTAAPNDDQKVAEAAAAIRKRWNTEQSSAPGTSIAR
jgi:hypothetical protein